MNDQLLLEGDVFRILGDIENNVFLQGDDFHEWKWGWYAIPRSREIHVQARKFYSDNSVVYSEADIQIPTDDESIRQALRKVITGIKDFEKSNKVAQRLMQ